MNRKSQPFVSIVTPLYNAEQYLDECIQSVLAQTYQNWEYVIVNNCSTDRSTQIASKYAEKDERIRIIHNDSFLSSMQNQNNALHKISPESKYCKIVHSDDWLFSDSIEKMVNLCEQNPNVGIVSSYVLSNKRIFGIGLPYTQTVVPGSVPCKMWLLEKKYLFGNPSSLLIRSDLVRQRPQLYDERFLNSDQITCYELLQNSDFGFIHQILSFMRLHEAQTSDFVNRCNAKVLDKLLLLHMFGSIYLGEEMKQKCLSQTLQKYYRDQGEGIFKLIKKECWEYHKICLEATGNEISKMRLIRAILLAMTKRVMSPRKLVRLARRNSVAKK